MFKRLLQPRLIAAVSGCASLAAFSHNNPAHTSRASAAKELKSKSDLHAQVDTDTDSFFRRNKSVRYEHQHSAFHARFSANYPHLLVMPMTPQLIALHTIIRDKETSRDDFVFYSNRIIRLLLEEALATLPFDSVTVTTPTQTPFHGYEFTSKLVGVSIVRAGEAMEQGLRDVAKGVRIGTLLALGKMR